MTTAATVTVDFAAEVAKFTSELKKVRKDVSDLKGGMDKAGEAFSSFQSGIRNVIGFLAVGAALRAIIQATNESERAIALLDNALGNVGANVSAASKDLQAYATSLQNVSTFSDEAILGVTTTLLAFRGLSSGTIKDATASILDVSTRLGVDLTSAAKTVGKALENPIVGMTALQKLGVRLSAGQKELVKDFIAVGDKASAQGVILGELEARYGGAAEAARNTLGGALTGLKNAFGDLLEVKGGLPEVSKQINEFTKLLQDPATKQSIDGLFDGLIKSFGFVIKGYLEIGKLLSQNRSDNKAEGFNAAFDLDHLYESQVKLAKQLETTREKMDALKRNGDEGSEAYLKLTARFTSFNEQLGNTQKLITEMGAKQNALKGVASEDSINQISKLATELRNFEQQRNSILQGVNQNVEAALTIPGFKVIESQIVELTAKLERLKFYAEFVDPKKTAAIAAATAAGGAKPEDFVTPETEAVSGTNYDNQLFVEEMNARNIMFANEAAMRKELENSVTASIEENQLAQTESIEQSLEMYQYNAERRAEMEMEAQKAITQQRTATVNAGIGLLQVFAQKSKTAAIALVAINKARAIAEAIQNTAVGATKQLTSGDPYTAVARAAAVSAWGAVQVGIIAATGFAEIAAIKSGGSAGVVGPGTPNNPIYTNDGGAGGDDPTYGATSKKSVTVVIEGNVFSSQETSDYLIERIQEAITDRDVVMIGANSRQALELAA